MDFEIQDKVRVVSYEELPLELRNKAIAKACGKEGEIVDRLYSEAEGGYIYRVRLEAIGAVSPQGGDLSEPVSQATLRIVKVFWGLSSALAYKRHFPAIDWLISYSLYADRLGEWYAENVSADFTRLRAFAMSVLQEESELEEIVRLVGADALSYKDRLTMEIAKSIREDYLHQNAFHEVDTYASLNKQYKMLKLIYDFYRLANDALERDVDYQAIVNLSVREKIGRAKYIPEENISELDDINSEIHSTLKGMMNGENQDV